MSAVRVLVALVAALSLGGCRGGARPDDGRARDRVLAQYLDALEASDADAALALVNPRTRDAAREDVARVVARLGGQDLDAATVTYQPTVSPDTAVATVTLSGTTERIELSRVDGRWYVTAGAAATSRSPASTARP